MTPLLAATSSTNDVLEIGVDIVLLVGAAVSFISFCEHILGNFLSRTLLAYLSCMLTPPFHAGIYM